MLGLVSAVGPLSIDMDLPALPTIGQALGAPPGAVQASLIVCYGALGLVVPASMVLSMEAHGGIAGTPSALGGTLHFVCGILVMGLLSPFAIGPPVPMPVGIARSAPRHAALTTAAT